MPLILRFPDRRRRRRSDAAAPQLPLGAPVAIFRPADRTGYIKRLAERVAGRTKREVYDILAQAVDHELGRLISLGVDEQTAQRWMLEFIAALKARLIADDWQAQA